MTIKRILEVTKSYAIRHFFKDKNFIKCVRDKLYELHKPQIELNEKARIANIFLKGFKSSLMEFIDNSTEEKILFS